LITQSRVFPTKVYGSRGGSLLSFDLRMCYFWLSTFDLRLIDFWLTHFTRALEAESSNVVSDMFFKRFNNFIEICHGGEDVLRRKFNVIWYNPIVIIYHRLLFHKCDVSRVKLKIWYGSLKRKEYVVNSLPLFFLIKTWRRLPLHSYMWHNNI
jgi:hypothetical protein